MVRLQLMLAHQWLTCSEGNKNAVETFCAPLYMSKLLFSCSLSLGGLHRRPNCSHAYFFQYIDMGCRVRAQRSKICSASLCLQGILQQDNNSLYPRQFFVPPSLAGGHSTLTGYIAPHFIGASHMQCFCFT